MSSVLRLVKGSPFVTIQGEGLRAGAPSVFLRLAGCDLRCHVEGGRFWNCDTPDSLPDYDIKKRMFKVLPTKHAFEASTRDIATLLTGFDPGLDLVITGGEPMLQSGSLTDLMFHMANKGRHPELTIETNCRHFDEGLTRYVGLPSLSPKLQSMLASPDIFRSREFSILKEWLKDRKYRQQTWKNAPTQLKIVCATLSEYEVARELFIYVKGSEFSDVTCIVQIADSVYADPNGLVVAVIADRGLCRLGTQQHKSLGIP